MINIIIADDFLENVEEALLVETARAALNNQQIQPGADLSIVIDDNDALRDLNLQFRSIDSPTDVLSFPSGEVDPETGNLYLGDIIISYPKAKAQAEAANHSVDCELRLLVVHGVLHLLGFDHATPEEQKEMWVIQNAILVPFGCTSPQADD
jgi:probable rRNA maturation factor